MTPKRLIFPANDDSIRAIHLITKTLADTIMEAKRGSKKQQKESHAKANYAARASEARKASDKRPAAKKEDVVKETKKKSN